MGQAGTQWDLPYDDVHQFAGDDDYFFGVLHSKVHETWTLNTCSWHGVGNDPTYNTSSCFNTFPFPWPPGQEPKDDSNVIEIAESARDLYAKREAWLNPVGAAEDELRERTLTNLYNNRPTWLDEAHRRLDRAVFAAYGWPAPLSDAELLQRLLTLNNADAPIVIRPYGIVREHSGDIEVESTLGAGTRFHLSFPEAAAVRWAELTPAVREVSAGSGSGSSNSVSAIASGATTPAAGGAITPASAVAQARTDGMIS